MFERRVLLRIFPIAFGLILSAAVWNSTSWAEGYPNESGCKDLENPSAKVKGWCVMIDRRKGNCLACHAANLKPWPEALPPGGNIAPPFVSMQERFPDKEKLRAQIWDPTQFNDKTVMPPFGKHMLISGEEIDNIVEFLLTI